MRYYLVTVRDSGVWRHTSLLGVYQIPSSRRGHETFYKVLAQTDGDGHWNRYQVPLCVGKNIGYATAIRRGTFINSLHREFSSKEVKQEEATMILFEGAA